MTGEDSETHPAEMGQETAIVLSTTSHGQEGQPCENNAAGTVASRRRDGRNYVQKGSLTEETLVAARNAARTNLKQKSNVTDEDKKEDRRAANRLSAFQSRQRRKMIIDDLQGTVADQARINADQAKEIAELKQQLHLARQESEMLRLQCGTAGLAPSMLAGQFMTNPTQLMLAQQQQAQLIQNTMFQNALIMAQQQGGQGGSFDGTTAMSVSHSQPGNDGNNNDTPPAERAIGEQDSFATEEIPEAKYERIKNEMFDRPSTDPS